MSEPSLADVVHEAVEKAKADDEARKPVTLTEFLLARISEDERHAAGGEHFASWNRSWDSSPVRDLAVDGVRIATLPMTLDEHVCRWDPARVLAECEAKRRIVEWATEPGQLLMFGVPPLMLLAQPYAEHPDFDPAWRP